MIAPHPKHPGPKHPDPKHPNNASAPAQTKPANTDGVIVLILRSYGVPSETFITREIVRLAAEGLQLHIFALSQKRNKELAQARRDCPQKPQNGAPEKIPQDGAPGKTSQDGAPGKIKDSWMPEVFQSLAITELPPRIFSAPRVYLLALRNGCRRPGFGLTLRRWLVGCLRYPHKNQWRAFFRALYIAHNLPENTKGLYCHYLHVPGVVGHYVSLLTGLPWAGSGHAYDIWFSPRWRLAELAASADWITTCNRAAWARLATVAPPEKTPLIIGHGVNSEFFTPPKEPRKHKDGRRPENMVMLRTVSRMVPKKGLFVLLNALALLPETLHWRFEHIGSGALSARLKRHCQALGLSSRVTWYGQRGAKDIADFLHQADIFVLPSRVDQKKNADGLPNVILEAQASACPTVATTVASLDEAVRHRHTGLLVPPDHPEALAAALLELILNPILRARMGTAARQQVVTDFSPEPGYKRIISLLATLGQETPSRETRHV